MKDLALFNQPSDKPKNAFKPEELRRNRNELNVELRKQKREENLSKCRNLASVAETDSEDERISAVDREGVMSENTEELLGAITSFSKLLPNVRNSLIDEVIRYEVVPRFIEFLRSPHTVEQVAAWALTNIASGTYAQTQYVIEAGAILVFVELLNSPVDDVKEQAAWVLENVAGDSPRCRDIVLCENASAPLLTLLYENINLTMLRNATWTISNFCRGKNPPPD
ncbi:Importin subunit alpha-7 [Mortierella sp. AD010]|nr:Importin subunit alpha-7 [Mortierella sp. AD010]